MKAAVVAAIVSAVVASATATAGTMALITGAQIKNGSVQLADLSPRAKRALRGQRGPRGLRGFTGPPGAQGPAGAPGAPGGFDPAKLQYITGPTVTLAPGQTSGAQASCPAGSAAVSGGFSSTDGHVAFSETLGATFHSVLVSNDTDPAVPIQIHATVVCSAR
jgi:hypothetical protein